MEQVDSCPARFHSKGRALPPPSARGLGQVAAQEAWRGPRGLGREAGLRLSQAEVLRLSALDGTWAAEGAVELGRVGLPGSDLARGRVRSTSKL